mgnify:FL=1
MSVGSLPVIPESETCESQKSSSLGIHAYLFADWNEKSSSSDNDPNCRKVYFNCHDGTFNAIDQYDMSDDLVVDLTGLNLNDRDDRDWAWKK